MARLYKTKTPEQYAEDLSRSQTIRLLVRESGLTWLPICYRLGVSYQTVNSWLKQGLDPEQYDRLLRALKKARAGH